MKKRIFPGVGVPHDGWASDLSEIRKEPKGFPFTLGTPNLTWGCKNACIYDVHKCSRASFSREHQTGILFFELAHSNTIILKRGF